ncbi:TRANSCRIPTION TERMINATION FACTOR MTERF9 CHLOROPLASTIC [Salix koriyanagi]|uniref:TRANSCRIPTION TERMINATION FACTOR MTERF9 CHLOROPLASTIC n=1 Tax=Salix koriyanagi TaxID=2511006 RepID=A0A9Q0ZBI8_9ROSI|nr:TRANSCRIPTION TERMINATION FACTOR MTERF9 CHLOROPLASTIC [Salix koriyanagi]
MAVSSVYPLNPALFSHSHSLVLSQAHLKARSLRRIIRRGSRVVVLSTHSNAKILKPNRKSRYGDSLSTYDTDDDFLLNDEFAESVDFEVDGNKRVNSQRTSGAREGGQRLLNERTSKNTHERSIVGKSYHTKNRIKEAAFSDINEHGKRMTGKSAEERYPKLYEEIDLDKKCLPLLDYLSTFDLKEPHFIQIYERHMQSLQINVFSARERLDYLLSIGVKHRDIKRILLRQPQILEYTVESNLKSHIAFLMQLGIPNSRIGQIIAAAPSLFSYSVENSLKPTVRYLVEEVGINEKNICKVVQLSPQILVQRIDISWNTRYLFLSKELGASRDSVVKMVTKHPQLLHYSIDDGFLPRINFLRSIGLRDSDILKVLTSLTQVLSLSVEDNLKPKYMYLINELRNEVRSLTKYPTYLSLSLEQRIRPRHRFLVSLKKAPKGPFPLSLFVPTDESFCQQWAGTSVEKYLAFRQQLLLKEFAQKYERRGAQKYERRG